MIHSVSPVSFRATAPAATQDPISRPGKFTTMPTEQAAPQTAPKKKGKFWKGLAIAAGTALVVAGGLVLGKNKGWIKSVENLAADAKFMDKAKNYVRIAADWLDQKAWQPIVKLVSNNAANAANP